MVLNKEIIEMLRYTLSVIGTLGGTFLGGWLTGKSQEKMFQKQKQWILKKRNEMKRIQL